jgi:hypothetical protein
MPTDETALLESKRFLFRNGSRTGFDLNLHGIQIQMPQQLLHPP